MKSLREILIIIGLAVWISVGTTIFYKYGVLERYQVGGSEGVTLIHNSLTGKGWVCSRDGCITAEQDSKNREKFLELEKMMVELNKVVREERSKRMLEFAKMNPEKVDTLILIDYIVEKFEEALANLEGEGIP